jgi:xylulose-5-phosphate/fructose-6-phosphate phosphoketolase
VLGEPGGHPHALDEIAFTSIFTKDKPVLVNFHGYASPVRSLLFGRRTHVSRKRFTINGYKEEGTTTTPYDLLRMNGVDRYTIAQQAVEQVAASSPKIDTKAHELIVKFQRQSALDKKTLLTLYRHQPRG